MERKINETEICRVKLKITVNDDVHIASKNSVCLRTSLEDMKEIQELSICPTQNPSLSKYIIFFLKLELLPVMLMCPHES